MVKAVLTTKVDPAYDDLPEERYHFPRTYLGQIEKAVGDWIVYYEPRRTSSMPSSIGGRQAYFATARVDRISVDPHRPDHFYAHVSGYLEFASPVPFAEGSFYYEGLLQKSDGSTNRGAFGRAVRNLPDHEFDVILTAGFAQSLGAEPGQPTPTRRTGFAEAAIPFSYQEEPETTERRVVEQLLRRPFRERAFASSVKIAHDDTCAVTGLKIINGGGRSEVQAAHIRPVEHAGPDSVRNGVALSGTVHWMFDRGLISFDDDLGLLVARDRLPDAVQRTLLFNERPVFPQRTDLRPHPQFLHYHREHVFKG
jgi:putative restriction endonuclease